MTQSSTDEAVAANVRAEMGRHKCTQVTLADRIGMTQQTLSRRLGAQTSFTVTELGRVADALGVPMSALIGREAVA